jgi:hypothetical protein
MSYFKLLLIVMIMLCIVLFVDNLKVVGLQQAVRKDATNRGAQKITLHL